MPKTTETREKEMDGGKNAPHLFITWDNLTSKVRKDIDPAAHSSVVAVAKRYDAAVDKFVLGMDKKAKSTEGFAKLWNDLQDADKEIDDVSKAIGKLFAESFETVKSIEAKTADDEVANWEELLKRAQNTTKEYKGYCDHLIKLNEGYDKQITQALDKVRPQLDGVKGEMNRTNSELNALEAQFRSAVIVAENAAVKQNKPDVAKAVKAVLKEFG